MHTLKMQAFRKSERVLDQGINTLVHDCRKLWLMLTKTK